MGGGASLPSDKSAQGVINEVEKIQDKETIKSEYLQQVEFFVHNVYLNFPFLESLRLILSSKLSQSAFEKYMKDINKTDQYEKLLAVCTVLASGSTNEVLLNEFVDLVNSHINPPLVSSDETSLKDSGLSFIPLILKQQSAALIASDPNEVTDEKIKEILNSLRDEIEKYLANSYFEGFVQSRAYGLWRSVERGHALATTVKDIKRAASHCQTDSAQSSASRVSQGQSPVGHKLKVNPIFFNARYNSQVFTEFSTRAFNHLENDELMNILTGDNWMASLLSAAEALPIGFTVNIKDKRTKGFPYAYSNKYFEIMTGHTRAELIGHSNRSVFKYKISPKKAEEIRKHLEAGRVISDTVDAQMKDGTIFRDLFSLKAIYNQNGECYYILCMHVNVTGLTENIQVEINLVRQLMNSLPSRIITEDTGLTSSHDSPNHAERHSKPFEPLLSPIPN